MSADAQQARRFHCHKSFADFIASDDELLIFRRFDRLNVRSLLYMQSRLMTLEAQLAEYDQEDAADGSMEVMLSAKCWETLQSRAAEERPREAERLELIREIQNTTYQYSMHGHRTLGAEVHMLMVHQHRQGTSSAKSSTATSSP